MSARLAGMGRPQYQGVVANNNGLDWTGRTHFVPSALEMLRQTKTPTLWFVNSMSDTFGEGVTDDQIFEMFETFNQTPQHHYQVLTKRTNRMLRLSSQIEWTDNIWAGTSIEMNKYAGRARLLAKVPAAIKFVSAEPLLDDLKDLDLAGIDWLITGGESGRSKDIRPMDPAWARTLLHKCRAANVPFFLKQWGEYGPDGVRRGKKDNGHLLDGVEYFEMPAAAARIYKPSKSASVTPIAAPAPKFSLTTSRSSPGSVLSPRIGYREPILERLRKNGAMSGADLRAANGVDASTQNGHSWALVDLQAKGLIRKSPLDGRYRIVMRVVADVA